MQKIPKVFISYSWDNKEHQDWILNLATMLRTKFGADVILDQFELSAGKSLTHFMEKSLEIADKVILILTPNYKTKAENRQKGVGFEYSMISQNLYELQSENNKFIPVLRKGTFEETLPGYIKSLLTHDMRDDSTFESDLFKLARLIYDSPEVIKPELGEIPDFDNLPKEKDPILEKAQKLTNQLKFKQQKNIYLSSQEGFEEANYQFNNLLAELKKKAEFYKERTGFFFSSSGMTYSPHQHEESYGNLIGEGGICFHFFLNINEKYIAVSEWDKPPKRRGDNRFYFRGEEPKQLNNGDIYYFDTDENLNPKWRNKDDILLEIEDIAKKYLVELMDKIDEKKKE